MGTFRQTMRIGNTTLWLTKQFFFDRPNVIRKLNIAERAAMSKIGAHGRKVMKTMMKPATSQQPHSRPGEPPKTQISALIRRMIFFAYSPRTHSVVIGPTKIRTGGADVRPVGMTVPELLDKGGVANSRRHFVMKDRARNRIISYNSLAAVKIMRTQSYKKGMGKPHRQRNYHPMVMKAGPKKFKPRPFRGPTLGKLLSSPKLKSAWAVL